MDSWLQGWDGSDRKMLGVQYWLHCQLGVFHNPGSDPGQSELGPTVLELEAVPDHHVQDIGGAGDLT